MMEPRNRVVRVSRFGAPEGLEVVDAPLPTAGRGEVRVRVLASSLNYTEVLIRRHLYPQTMRLRPPFVMGYDVVGKIDQIGDGVRDFQVGDRVADMTVVGSNADYRTLRADDVARVPVGVDAAEAATLILSWTTAYSFCTARPGCSKASACSCTAPPAPSVRRCSCSGGWPALSCGAQRAAITWPSSGSWAQRR
jgi:NADPH:quinone reductase-like Zn-dependent oxidoreductase